MMKSSWQVLYSAASTSPLRQGRSPVRKSSTRPQTQLRFSHDEAESKNFDLAMTASSIRWWWSLVGKYSTWSQWCVQFGYNKVESEGLLLGCSNVSD